MLAGCTQSGGEEGVARLGVWQGRQVSLKPAWLMLSGSVLYCPPSPQGFLLTISLGCFSLLLLIYRQMNQLRRAGLLYTSVLCSIFYLLLFWARSAEPCSLQGGSFGVRGQEGACAQWGVWGVGIEDGCIRSSPGEETWRGMI